MNKRQLIILISITIALAIVSLITNSKLGNINRTFYGKSDNWEVNMKFAGHRLLDANEMPKYKYNVNFRVYFVGDENEFANQPLSIKIKYSRLGLSSVVEDGWKPTKKAFEWSVGSGSSIAHMLDYFDPEKTIDVKCDISMGSVNETILLKELRKPGMPFWSR